jgi:hypothetical protein
MTTAARAIGPLNANANNDNPTNPVFQLDITDLVITIARRGEAEMVFGDPEDRVTDAVISGFHKSPDRHKCVVQYRRKLSYIMK